MEWIKELENLAAVNYNMYFGSPADRADKLDEHGDKVSWTFEQSKEELITFITTQITKAREEALEEAAHRLVDLGAPEWVGDELYRLKTNI